MKEILKALGWASAMLVTAFFGQKIGLSDNQANAMIVIMIGGYVATMGQSRSCGKGTC